MCIWLPFNRDRKSKEREGLLWKKWKKCKLKCVFSITLFIVRPLISKYINIYWIPNMPTRSENYWHAALATKTCWWVLNNVYAIRKLFYVIDSDFVNDLFHVTVVFCYYLFLNYLNPFRFFWNFFSIMPDVNCFSWENNFILFVP